MPTHWKVRVRPSTSSKTKINEKFSSFTELELNKVIRNQFPT